MKKPDRWSSLFWLAFSIFICVESVRLKIGTFHNPGTGFFPFLAGIVFGILSLVLLIRSLVAKERVDAVLGKVRWKNVIFVLICLFVYAVVLERLGFMISTILFIAILLKVIEKKRWSLVVLISVSATLIFWVIFQLWLQSQLPKGVLGI
jgi:putative tricarboxylic transport membrane protein